MKPLPLLSLLASSLVLAACASVEPPSFRTVPGTDVPSVLATVAGQVAVAHAGDDIPCDYLLSIGTGPARSCLLFPVLDAPSGVVGLVPENDRTLLVLRLDPDGKGPRASTYTLVRRRCAERLRACRPEERAIASWTVGASGARYRKTLALSPDGRTLALLPTSSFIRMNGFAPPAPEGFHFADQRSAGELVLVDLQSGAVRDTGITVLDEEPITWSADGQRLLVVGSETLDRLTPAMRDEMRGSEGEAGKPIPVIETWNIRSAAVEMLAIGLSPIWSPDQRTLMYAPVKAATLAYFEGEDPTLRHEPADAYELRDLASGARSPAVLPGLAGPRGPIAFVGPRKVLYWAVPSVHTPPRTTIHNSPLIGPKQMVSLKVGDLDTHEAGLVYQAIDPRAQVGFHAHP